MADAGDPEDELDITEPVEPEADLEDEGTETDEQESSRVDAIDERPEAETEQGETQDARPERQPTRGENRFQALRNDNQRLNTELADTRRRLDELTRRIDQPRASESPEQRAQRHSLMTPEERMMEGLNEARSAFDSRINAMQFQSADLASRTAFQTKAAVDPLYAKYAPKVEAFIAEERAKGFPIIDRDIVLAVLIGKAALERRGSKEGRQEVQRGRERVRRAQTRPVNSGSDTQPTRQRGSTPESRLDGVQI